MIIIQLHAHLQCDVKMHFKYNSFKDNEIKKKTHTHVQMKQKAEQNVNESE